MAMIVGFKDGLCLGQLLDDVKVRKIRFDSSRHASVCVQTGLAITATESELL